jgi:hypothetical protein
MTRLAKAVAALAVTLGLAACDDGAAPEAEGRVRAPVEAIARFVGGWQAVSGTVTVSCPGYASSSTAVMRRVKWSEGIRTDLVQTQEGVPCVVDANITGATASGSGPSCTLPDKGSYTVSVYTFAIAEDGQTAQEDFSGTVTATVDGAAVACAVGGSATYQKVGR